MRASRKSAYFWSRYRMPTSPPKIDGPAPLAAPQNMNNTKTNEFVDPIDDKFPKSIRGNFTRPDVPTDQYIDSWYVCDSTVASGGELKPWSASAPPNAFRFRPFNDFDSKGRNFVEQWHKYHRYGPEAASRVGGPASVGRGSAAFPFRDAFLTSIHPDNATAAKPNLERSLSRAVQEKHAHRPWKGPLDVQRDVGRWETPPSFSQSVPVDRTQFPFHFQTTDWYEYEISKARMRRFRYENRATHDVDGSEVTYRIVLEGLWDHHLVKLAEDVAMFVKDVGRQIVEERLAAIRRQLEELESGRAKMDPEMVAAFHCSASGKGAFGATDVYDDAEVAAHMARDLRLMELQCVGLINRCNIPVPGATNLYDPNTSWPFVETLEPWVRMAEYWTSSSDTSFTELEASTNHAEFRKYFRVVVVKMPFQSSEFEKRIVDIRHWIHRHCSAEFQTIYKRNVVHDAAVFPTEHDPAHRTTHEHHRMFSFALDWNAAPAEYRATETVRDGDSWESIALRLGTTAAALQEANAQEQTADGALPPPGSFLRIPPTATRRSVLHAGAPRLLPTVDESGAAVIRNWEDAARALSCSVEEVQMANGAAAARYDTQANAFHPTTVQLHIPVTAWDRAVEEDFARTEDVGVADTFESVADRLGCTVDDLRAANPGVESLSAAGCVNVPASATRPRRLVEPLLRPSATTDSLLPRTLGEAQSVPPIPLRPKNASRFPHEYHTTSSRFPVTPNEPGSFVADDWLSYTAEYLDKGLQATQSPQPVFTVNKLWPMQQVPNKLDQTPFEEDQTWMMTHVPLQQMERHHPEKDLQDLPFANLEQFAKSIEWTAP